MPVIVLCTGGFDPCHEGHISYLKEAREIANTISPYALVVVGLNSDKWLTRKKGKPFMNWKSRAAVMSSLRMVDDVIDFDDSDNTAIDAIKKMEYRYPDSMIIFANGGDRTAENIPEMKWAEKENKIIDFEFGVGGTKKENSSSIILNNWSNG